MLTTDVVVVGGGPAGAAAAITLARAGRDVVLLDKATFPRDKCCGDGLTTGALRRLASLGLRPAAVPSWQAVDDVWVRSPSGRVAQFPLPSDGVFGAVARRADLDAALLDVARHEGVKIHDGHAAVGASVSADWVVVEAEGLGPVTARYAVAADGMWSPLRKLLLPGSEDGYLGEWHAFRQYFRGVAPAGASQLWVWFEPELLPGYAWSFPLADGRANVGFGIHRQAGSPTKAMKAQWPALLAKPHVREVLGLDDGAESEAAHKAWPIPARVGSTALTAGGGRVLFVGDAARATDSMTGEGIGQALETGMQAAEAIGAVGPRRASDAAALYEDAVRRGMGVDDRMARLLSRALKHRKGARGAVRIAGASDWTRRNFARWLFEDYPRAILLTPHRWRPGMLHGPPPTFGG